MKKMKKLTQEFNTATIKKGDTFEINLPIGGIVGQAWKDPKVVKGKVTLVKAPSARSGGCMGPFSAAWIYKAEAVGEVEITATSLGGKTSTFKVRVV